MAKLEKDLKAKLEALNNDQLERKVDELRQTIPQLNEQLDFASRMLRDRRAAETKRILEDARKRNASRA